MRVSGSSTFRAERRGRKSGVKGSGNNGVSGVTNSNKFRAERPVVHLSALTKRSRKE